MPTIDQFLYTFSELHPLTMSPLYLILNCPFPTLSSPQPYYIWLSKLLELVSSWSYTIPLYGLASCVCTDLLNFFFCSLNVSLNDTFILHNFLVNLMKKVSFTISSLKSLKYFFS